MKKNYYRKRPPLSNIDLRSEENILRSQDRYVPLSEKIKRWIPYALFFLIVAVIIVVWVFGVKREQAIGRDAQRFADMHSVQAAFEELLRKSYTYEGAAVVGCYQIGMPVSSCRLEGFLPGIATLDDPGSFAYTVTELPTADRYEISFTLERSHGSLTAGVHRLNQNGIQ